MASKKLALKVMSADRSLRKGVIADDFTDLMKKCREKFNIREDQKIKIVIEKDGCEVDEEFFLVLPTMTQVMLLVDAETWRKSSGISNESCATSCSNEEVAGSSKPSLLELVAKIRNKQTSLYQNTVKRTRINIKFKIGWLLWANQKYVQVRRKTGGGVRDVDMPGESTHQDLLLKGQQLFFPNGQNSFRGHLHEYIHILGDFEQRELAEGITLAEYAANSQSSRPRIYLMSKPKIQQEEEFELPDLGLTHEDVELLDSIIGEKNEKPCNTAVTSVYTTVQSDETTTAVQSDETTTAVQSDETTTAVESDQSTSVDTIVQSGPGNGRLRLGRRRAALRCRQFMAASLQRHIPGNMSVSDSNRRNSSGPQVIEVVDSEDEELQRALMESIDNDQNTNARSEEPTVQLSNLLKEFQSNIRSEDKQEIIVSRKCVLESAFRALRRRFDTGCNLYVKFSGEMGLDHGGPRREFFRLVLLELCSSSLFEGDEFSKFFSHDIKKLEQNEYHLAGKLVAMSVLHDGPGLHFLEENLSKLMLGIEPDLGSFRFNLLPDEEVRQILTELKKADTYDERDRFLSQHGDWLINQGYNSAWKIEIDERNHVLETLIKQLIYYRTLPEIHQFTGGMDTVFGFWGVMKSNPETCLPLLCYTPTAISKAGFMALFHTMWSEEGSNRRRLEEDTIYSWEIFLQDVQDKTVDVTFEELLVFISGADKIPPCGFSSKIGMEFYTNEDRSNRLPFVSTCSLTLSLPRGIANPDEFRITMVKALKESYGFGKM